MAKPRKEGRQTTTIFMPWALKHKIREKANTIVDPKTGKPRREYDWEVIERAFSGS